MAKVWFKYDEDAVVSKLAETIADCMREDLVNIDRTGDTWHLKFPNNEGSFDLREPKKTKHGGYRVDLTLLVNGKAQWHYGKDDISLTSFKQAMNNCYMQGFPRNKRIAYKWPHKTVLIKCADGALTDAEKRTITTIGEALKEHNATVTHHTGEHLRVVFRDGMPHFVITYVFEADSSNCNFILELVWEGKAVWRQNFVHESLTTFKNRVKELAEYGFAVENRMWKWGTAFTEPTEFETRFQDIETRAGVLNIERPEVVSLARAVAAALQEPVVTIKEDRRNEFSLQFESKSSWIRLSNVSLMDDDGWYMFSIYVFAGDMIIWQTVRLRLRLEGVHSMLSLMYRNGFETEGHQVWRWPGSGNNSQEVAHSSDRVHIIGKAVWDVSAVTLIADCIAGALGESDISVEEKDKSHWRLYIEGKLAHFVLSDNSNGSANGKIYLLNMYDGASELWHYMFRGSEIDKLKAKLTECHDIGFPLLNKKRFIWQRDRVENPDERDAHYKDAKITWKEHYARVPSGTEDFARCIASALGEDRATLSRIYDSEYSVAFDGRDEHFNLYYCRSNGDDTFNGRVSLVIGGVVDWRYETDSITMQDLYNMFVDFREAGFPLDDGTMFKWNESVVPVNTPYGRVQVNDLGLESARPEVVTLARAVADALDETRITIREVIRNEFKVSFQLRDNWFVLANVSCKEDGLTYAFSITLYDGDKIVWWYTTTDMTLHNLQDLIYRNYRDGFKYDGNVYFWNGQGTSREPQSDDEEQTMMPSGGVVTGQITSIRAVALKYDGKVVAFRLKTNLGSFDISREVATRYGFSDFKTEKFIRLESVNGVLMSESERKNQKFIPDVSDNEADCFKLITALFNS